jgi:hypothetical protein
MQFGSILNRVVMLRPESVVHRKARAQQKRGLVSMALVVGTHRANQNVPCALLTQGDRKGVE